MLLVNYLSRIPQPKLVELIGAEVVIGLQEFNIANKPVEMAMILIELKGNDIFRTPGLLKTILWAFKHDDLSSLNVLFENKEISDFEKFRGELQNKKWGNNKFGEAILKFFGIDDQSFLKTEHIEDKDHEIIIPRLSSVDEEFQGQKIFIPETYPLHTYQKTTKDKIIDELLKPGIKFLLHMPTGSGKTTTAVESIVDFWRVKGKRSGFIVWFAHSKELCDQAYDTFKNVWQAKGDYPLKMFKVFGEAAPNIKDVENGIFFIGFQKFHSMVSRNDFLAIKLRDYTRLIIVDEAHKSIAYTYKKSIDYLLFKDTRLMGLTATPGRSEDDDGSSTQHLSSFYDNRKITICDELGNEMYDAVKYLQDNEYLAKLKRIEVNSELIFSEEEKKKIFSNISESNYNLPSDIIKKLAVDHIRNSKIISEIEKAVISRSDPTLVFSTSISHAVIMKILLQQKGIISECVLGNTPARLRSQYIKDFKSNKLPVLINYGVLTTGFDAPNIRTLVISRPTTSVVLYSQMLGRGLRGPKMGGISNENTLVDIIDNYGSFGTERAAFNYFDEYYS